MFRIGHGAVYSKDPEYSRSPETAAVPQASQVRFMVDGERIAACPSDVRCALANYNLT